MVSKQFKIENVNNKKKTKLVVIISTIMGLIAIRYIYSFLVTKYVYFFVLILIALVVTYIARFYSNRIKRYSFSGNLLYISTVLYFLFFSLIFILKVRGEPETFLVSINGFYTSKIDGVLFEFENTHFDRKVDLSSYDTNKLKNMYRLKLELVPTLPGIYYIENISVIPNFK